MPSEIQVFFPKESTPALYPNEKVGERVTNYAEQHTSSIPQYISDYHDHIRTTQPKTASYMISISEAQALVFLARTVGAKRVLEIGAYVGLSMLTWSHAVGPKGHVTGLEFEPTFAEMAEEVFAVNGIQNTELVIGNALETLQDLSPSEPYDIIFIDAQKTGYPGYLSTILRLSQPGAKNRLLRPGGLIMADNVLRCGFAADDSEDNPWRNYDFGPHRKEYWKSADVMSVREYNQVVAESGRMESWLCPLWDGLNISRLLD